jgi:lipopolysaccharide transport system permease protein
MGVRACLYGANVSTETLIEREIERREVYPTVTSSAAQVIEPPRSWVGINLGEIWRYRELLYFLTWRDVKVRYKQTALGAAWAILQPVMTMVVFTIFFGRLAKLGDHTGGIPYPIYVYTGLLAWTFFANSITKCSNSLVSSANLITKVYFPRLIIPLSAIGAGLVDLAISMVVLMGLMVHYGTGISCQLALVPLFLCGAILAATGVGMLLSAFSVAYRDFFYVVPFMVQVWMYLTPMVPGKWRWLLSLNPMCGLIDGFRAAFLGSALDWPRIGLSLAVSAFFFVLGAFYFRKVESRFADII